MGLRSHSWAYSHRLVRPQLNRRRPGPWRGAVAPSRGPREGGEGSRRRVAAAATGGRGGGGDGNMRRRRPARRPIRLLLQLAPRISYSPSPEVGIPGRGRRKRPRLAVETTEKRSNGRRGSCLTAAGTTTEGVGLGIKVCLLNHPSIALVTHLFV